MGGSKLRSRTELYTTSCNTVEPGFRNQFRSLWMSFFNPGSALNPVRYIYIIKPDLFTGILSVLTPNQLSPLNPRFLKTRFHCKYLLRAEKPQCIFGTNVYYGAFISSICLEEGSYF